MEETEATQSDHHKIHQCWHWPSSAAQQAHGYCMYPKPHQAAALGCRICAQLTMGQGGWWSVSGVDTPLPSHTLALGCQHMGEAPKPPSVHRPESPPAISLCGHLPTRERPLYFPAFPTLLLLSAPQPQPGWLISLRLGWYTFSMEPALPQECTPMPFSFTPSPTDVSSGSFTPHHSQIQVQERAEPATKRVCT